MDLLRAGPRVPAGQSPRAAVGRDLRHVLRGRSTTRVALAGQRGYGVRADVDAAVDATGEVDAEERQVGVGHRVDQAAHQRDALRDDLAELAAEREDAHTGLAPGGTREPVAVQAGADRDPIGLDHVVGVAPGRSSPRSRSRSRVTPVRSRRRRP